MWADRRVLDLFGFAYALFGQSAALARDIPAAELTKTLAAEAQEPPRGAAR